MRGREFTEMDNRTSQAVAIVSEGLANTYWRGEDTIGKRLSIDDQQWRSVVGIVPDVRHDGREWPARPTICIPLTQYPRDQLTLLVRTDSDPASFTTARRDGCGQESAIICDSDDGADAERIGIAGAVPHDPGECFCGCGCRTRNGWRLRGVLGSLALSRTPSGMLFGVSATDPWRFYVVPALLFLVVLVASFLPARIAASVEPMIALRNE